MVSVVEMFLHQQSHANFASVVVGSFEVVWYFLIILPSHIFRVVVV